MENIPPLPLHAAVSPERMSRYLAWADGDLARSEELYAINTAISEALYTPLQMLEVALRNRCHTVLSVEFGPYWFDQFGVLLTQYQIARVLEAKVGLVLDMPKALRATPAVADKLTPGRIVAALTFGFWTAFFGTVYENTLWRRCLHKITMNPPPRLKRSVLSTEFTAIRLLRNRVAHHEPVLYFDLKGRHDRILEVTGWLLPSAAKWIERHGRFPQVYEQHEAAIQAVRRIHKGQKAAGQ
ncbi:Abi family protein [Azospirillum formosense]|uniref:Abi family protein n=1 Tax=Azospirillum formosense TaxID=861533 RepID=UPI0031E991AD